jgi:DNA repair protein RadC
MSSGHLILRKRAWERRNRRSYSFSTTASHHTWTPKSFADWQPSMKTSSQLFGVVELLAALLTPRPYEKIRGPSDVAALLMVQMAHLDQEELRTVLLDNKNQVQRIVTIYRGNVNTSVIRVGEVFKEALKKNCPAIILAHNHPSGDPTPSPEDERVTVQLVKAGKLLDVEIHDHLVIGHGKFVSMKERGLGFRRI